ncbi:SlyX family protein [Roseobacteraceae bacterium S113]
MEDNLMIVEERVAHLERLAEELSDQVARQAQTIDVLERRVHMLMEREAAREAEGGGGGGVVLGDERPPHY